MVKSKVVAALQWFFGVQNVGLALWLYGSQFEYIKDANLPAWLLPLLGLFFLSVLGIIIAQRIGWKQLPPSIPGMLAIVLPPYVYFLVTASLTALEWQSFLDDVAFVTTMTSIGAMTLVVFLSATRGLIILRKWGSALFMSIFMLLFCVPAILGAYVILNGRFGALDAAWIPITELIVITLLNIAVEYKTFLREVVWHKK